MKNRTVLISGSSVAGPALAYWLHRHGFVPTIVERAPALRDGGYAVDFRGEAHLGVLRRMGVLDAIERARTGMGSMSYVNAAGKQQARMPADLFAGDVEILRGDLGRILYDATKGFTEYVFGDSITSLDEDADGVDVTFERGAPRRFDLVIGADGLHSNTRRLAFGPEERFVKHLGLYCAIFTTTNYLGLDHTGHAYRTAGRLVALYSARHNAEAKAVFYFASPLMDLNRRDVARQQEILAEQFTGNGWQSERLLREMRRAPDFYFDSVGQVHMDTWSRGRVALVGDAAYCPSSLSGMGSGLALIGAYVLAGELAAAGGDHRVAFARYEREMREYATGCQKMGDGVAKLMVPGSRMLASFLNRYYKLMPYLPGKNMAANMARKAAENITLRDYETLRRPA
ncbi:FAD-dependent monooxygenase [Nonomuraea roseoviolacea]|uniref:2-polyprenyl-6-methoxyphenol hydroxylase-like FAD-dependent oxidoreductase n=1 Tax=Nonomuraea roseoviolacea subsp. carminata TaxID=160689 RepID=A0ABT1K3W3_9ACTN|nr:FAD-dependent monooxygenase [Nonomuraea roseoviolacea]MCP2348683.1 2-polyprenyl-6-methoxyphenol hydroxylase-like FAD-dependent oxidoreductase [Nonomuraea roseoviolacea subsp. carminata]